MASIAVGSLRPAVLVDGAHDGGGQFPDVEYVDWLGAPGGEVIEGRFGQTVDEPE